IRPRQACDLPPEERLGRRTPILPHGSRRRVSWHRPSASAPAILQSLPRRRTALLLLLGLDLAGESSARFFVQLFCHFGEQLRVFTHEAAERRQAQLCGERDCFFRPRGFSTTTVSDVDM